MKFFIVFSFLFHYNINKGEMPAILSFPSYCKVKTIGRLVFLGRTKIYLPGTLSDTYCPDGVQTPTKNKKHARSVLNFETAILRLLIRNDYFFCSALVNYLPLACAEVGASGLRPSFFPASIAQASPGVPPVIFNMPNFFGKEQFYADFLQKKWNSSKGEFSPVVWF